VISSGVQWTKEVTSQGHRKKEVLEDSADLTSKKKLVAKQGAAIFLRIVK
jgi:hypothetical protein